VTLQLKVKILYQQACKTHTAQCFLWPLCPIPYHFYLVLPRSRHERLSRSKTYGNNCVHHDLYNSTIRKTAFATLGYFASPVLSQQCCEVDFISVTVVNPRWDLTTKNYWNPPPHLNLQAGSASARRVTEFNVNGFLWAVNPSPYDGRGLVSPDFAASW